MPASSDSAPSVSVNVLAGFLQNCPELQQKDFVGRLVLNLQEDHVFKSSEEERGGGLDPILASASRKFHSIGRFTVIYCNYFNNFLLNLR